MDCKRYKSIYKIKGGFGLDILLNIGLEAFAERFETIAAICTQKKEEKQF